MWGARDKAQFVLQANSSIALVQQLILFMTRYNCELDKQPVVRDLEDVEVD